MNCGDGEAIKLKSQACHYSHTGRERERERERARERIVCNIIKDLYGIQTLQPTEKGSPHSPHSVTTLALGEAVYSPHVFWRKHVVAS